MKLNATTSTVLKAALAACVLCCAMLFTARGEDSSASRQVGRLSTKVETNDASSLTAIPQSVFIIPRTTSEGKDPFFPQLTDYIPAPPAPKTSKPSSTASFNDLKLQGISGYTDARLCVISGVTLAVGEQAGVPTSAGRVQVRCLEINETNVVIELGGEKRVLRFGKAN